LGGECGSGGSIGSVLLFGESLLLCERVVDRLLLARGLKLEIAGFGDAPLVAVEAALAGG